MSSTTYTSGSYTLTGRVSPVYATVAANQTVTFDLDGTNSSFDITALQGALVSLNAVRALQTTISAIVLGGTVMLGSSVGAGDTLDAQVAGSGAYIVGDSAAGLADGGTIAYGMGASGGGHAVLGASGGTAGISFGQDLANFFTAQDHIDDLQLNISSITGYAISGIKGGPQSITIAAKAGNFTFRTTNSELANGTYVLGRSGITLTSGPLRLTPFVVGGQVEGTDVTVCFLHGTRLATPSGETAIEDLAPGDLVATRCGDETIFRPITWIGRRRMDLGEAEAPAEDCPVRIRAGAFEGGVPMRDLLVTPEHCIFTAGRLIPARLLVNGGSILIDRGIRTYEFFHVELASHAILVAEGLETESYLDTGNRRRFSNAATSPSWPAGRPPKCWECDAAAPLAVDRETVEPVWRRLARRACGLGLTPEVLPPVIEDPDLRLVTASGLEIRPIMTDGCICAFVVPAGAASVRLTSRAARPSETIGPFVDDRRRLGVKVGRIGLAVGRRRFAIEAHLESGQLDGWHQQERGSAYRWTDGGALIPADLSVLGDRTAFLDIEVVQAGPYLTSAPAGIAAQPARLA